MDDISGRTPNTGKKEPKSPGDADDMNHDPLGLGISRQGHKDLS